jgi:hypothetical protein
MIGFSHHPSLQAERVFMTLSHPWQVYPEDITILRSLYQRKREIAQDSIMVERRRLWLRHAALDSQRPMLLAETMGVLDELVPLSILRCQADWARQMERCLRDLIFRYESVGDDFVVEPWIAYSWEITTSDYGAVTEFERTTNENRLASYHWTPPIQDLDKDFDRLRFRTLSVDREKTLAWKSFLEEHFGDILPVRLRASYWWTTGLTWTAINLIGLEGLMLNMYDNPRGLHRLMAFLRDEFNHSLDWFEREHLLTLNNEDDYVGSGSIGYTNALPRPGWQEGDPITAGELWGLSESQETVGVSPKLFEEFILPYQLPVISRFGLSYYGCCEPVHTRIRLIKQIPNLRRVSVSPWADEDIMARECSKEIIYCRKPKPTLISTEIFDEDAIRQDIRNTLQAAGGCNLEFAMKDVHTLNDQPWRLGRWVALAREESAAYNHKV